MIGKIFNNAKKWFYREYRYHPLLGKTINELEWNAKLDKEVEPFVREMRVKIFMLTRDDMFTFRPREDEIKLAKLKSKYKMLAEERIRLERMRIYYSSNTEDIELVDVHNTEFDQYNSLDEVEEAIEKLDRKMLSTHTEMTMVDILPLMGLDGIKG